MEITYNLNEIEHIAFELIKKTSSKIILLYGEMGVGKTTLVKSIVKTLGGKDEVNSPSFSIVNEYKINDGVLFHFDLYRVKDLDEAYNFGIEDYLFSNEWVIIEWPQIIEEALPKLTNEVKLTLNNDHTRTISLIKK